MVTEEATPGDRRGGHVSDEPAVLEAYAGDLSFVGKSARGSWSKPTRRTRSRSLWTWRGRPVPLSCRSAPALRIFTATPSPRPAMRLSWILSGMKKIDLIERRERVVSVVEPGVTFGELIPAAAKKGLRLNMPLQPRNTKSVVGSMLSREPVMMPHYHWDISDPIGSTEVVFGTGDLFRTGAAAGPGSIEEQRKAGGRQKEAAGPSAISLAPPFAGSPRDDGDRHVGLARCELIPQRSSPTS